MDVGACDGEWLCQDHLAERGVKIFVFAGCRFYDEFTRNLFDPARAPAF